MVNLYNFYNTLLGSNLISLLSQICDTILLEFQVCRVVLRSGFDTVVLRSHCHDVFGCAEQTQESCSLLAAAGSWKGGTLQMGGCMMPPQVHICILTSPTVRFETPLHFSALAYLFLISSVCANVKMATSDEELNLVKNR